MPIVKAVTDAQIVARVDTLIGYVDNWSDNELRVTGSDGENNCLNISITVKAPGKANGEQLQKLGGLLQEIKNMIRNREYWEFEEKDLEPKI